jgi:hypothetical protein
VGGSAAARAPPRLTAAIRPGLAALAALGVAGALDRVGRRSGATDAEVAARLPGDDLVGVPMWQSTRAITIRAARVDVWPWVVQIFTVVELEPERALVLHSTRHLLPPYSAISFSWAFVLASAGGGATRLLMRARTTFEPAWPRPLTRLFLWGAIGPGDYVNASVMLRGIRRRAERIGETDVIGAISSEPHA